MALSYSLIKRRNMEKDAPFCCAERTRFAQTAFRSASGWKFLLSQSPALTFYFFCVKEKESKKISSPFVLFPKYYGSPLHL
nr:hypothetical protein [uncultured Macellibacteroides sp.]